jgi:protocatechuate 3,4-dioxygenase, beta subunit
LKSTFPLFALFLTLLVISCNSQKTGSRNEEPTLVGGGCDGCEFMYLGMPDNINPVDTSQGWKEGVEKMFISGTVYQPDGRTPAENVIIYYWHTDNKGLYAEGSGMDQRAKDHGYLRGWIKTDEGGRYAIYTMKPAPYPSKTLPAHIHFSIKEPDVPNEYYIDDINFTDDPILSNYLKKYPAEDRGGSGIVSISREDAVQRVKRDIVLGLNIPAYKKNLQ